MTPASLDIALRYAACGLRVIPIPPGHQHPKGYGAWPDIATTDATQIRLWWTGERANWGIGIVTGAASGVWALDIDNKSEGRSGDDTLQEMIDTYGPLPATATAHTGSGKGRHLLFKWDPAHPIRNMQGSGRTKHSKLGPGLDVRGEGGFVLVHPHIHATYGLMYEWETWPDQIVIADAPGWLYALYEKPDPIPLTLETVPLPRLEAMDWDDALKRQFGNLSNLLRNDGWTQLGMSERWVRPGKDPRHGHSAILHDDDVLVIWSSEAPGELLDIGKITADGSAVSVNLWTYVVATRYGGNRIAARADFLPAREDFTTTIDRIQASTSSTSSTTSTQPVPESEIPDMPDPPSDVVTWMSEEELKAIEPPEPLIDGWLMRNSLAFLYGPPKKGKTFVALDIAMSVATGARWVGETDTHQGRVLYIVGEGVAGVPRRLAAWRAGRQIDTPATIEFLPRAIQLRKPEGILALWEKVCDYEPDLLVIDTLARATVGADENTAKDMGEVVAALDVLKSTGCCVLVVHHSGKDVTKGARGSSALSGAWDSALSVAGDTRAGVILTNAEQKDIEDGGTVGIGFRPAAGSIYPIRDTRVTSDGGVEFKPSQLTAARQSLIAAMRSEHRPHNRTAWVALGSGRSEVKRAAFDELVAEGWFHEVIEQTRDSSGRVRPETMYTPNPERMPA